MYCNFLHLQHTWCILVLIKQHLNFEMQCESMSCYRWDTGETEVKFTPSVYVEKANTTQLPLLKCHFLTWCEKGLFFLQDIWKVTID